jgi:hypothetical protein
MATGIRIPVGVGVGGRTALVSGSEYTEQLVKVALLDLESDNPFVDQSGLEDAVFALSDATVRALLQRRVRAKFTQFEAERVARLLAITFEQGETEGETEMTVAYLDMDTNERREVSRTITTRAR